MPAHCGQHGGHGGHGGSGPHGHCAPHHAAPGHGHCGPHHGAPKHEHCHPGHPNHPEHHPNHPGHHCPPHHEPPKHGHCPPAHPNHPCPPPHQPHCPPPQPHCPPPQPHCPPPQPHCPPHEPHCPPPKPPCPPSHPHPCPPPCPPPKPHCPEHPCPPPHHPCHPHEHGHCPPDHHHHHEHHKHEHCHPGHEHHKHEHGHPDHEHHHKHEHGHPEHEHHHKHEHGHPDHKHHHKPEHCHPEHCHPEHEHHKHEHCHDGHEHHKHEHKPDHCSPHEFKHHEHLAIGTLSTLSVRPWEKPTLSNTVPGKFEHPYACPPKILVGFNELDFGNTANLRIKADVKEVTREGLVVNLDSWSDSVHYSSGCAWLRVPESDHDIQHGSFSTEEDHPWQKPQPNTSRQIKFTYEYTHPPKVVVFLNGLDVNVKFNCRVRAFADNVTTTGFTLHVDSWSDTQLYMGRVSWVAHSAGRKDIVSGSVNTNDIRAWNAPRLENSGKVNFGVEFKKTPKVFLALNALDVDKSKNLRVKMSATDVTKTGMTWHLDSWFDTVLYMEGASYIAFEEHEHEHKHC